MTKKVYLIHNLDCAHCAAQIEEKLNALPEIQEATLTFATQQLRITAEDPDALLPKLLEVARKVEADVEILPRDAGHSSRSHHHEDGKCCDHEHHHHEDGECCDHEHHHHHEDGECCDHEHHHHEDGECCDHEHHHHHEDGECCDHEHHHHEDGECCNHEHHHHEHGDSCCCGHHHEEAVQGSVKKVYIIENLDCAHCAAKIEEKLNALPEIQEATLTFATKQLRITAEDPDALLPKMLETARKVEADVTICPREERSARRSGGQKKVYIIENLECAHCAAKIEEKLNQHPDIHEAVLTYATKQLRITAEDPDALLPQILEIARKVEPEVDIHPRDNGGSVKKVYIIENLDCAHCAAKIEEKLRQHPKIQDATLTFATKQLRITAADPDALMPEILEIARSVEAEVVIRGRDEKIGGGSCMGEAPEGVCPRGEIKSCCEKKTRKKFSILNQKGLMGIFIGAVLFAVGMLLEDSPNQLIPFTACVIAYAVLGLGVLKKAVQNLMRGRALDENFLMSVASLGAFFVGNYPEAVGVMLFYRVGEFFEEKAVARSRGQIMDAVDLRPEVVNLVEGDSIQVIPAQDAEIGDVLLVRPGDRIPLDGVVLEGDSRVDTAPITGEPVPVHVKSGDPVVSGCVNTSGQLKIRVEKELSQSMVTRILDSVENAAATKPKIDRFITRFAKYYTPIVVIIAVITALIPPIFTGDWKYWIYTSMTFLVMSCPCALVLSVPLAFFSGIGAGSKKGILFKGGTSMEAMDKVTTVIMDKTGTITKGEFKVQKILGDQEMLRLCASCEQQSTHPIAVSIVAAAKERNLELVRPDSLEEIPGKGLRARLQGREILCGNEALMQDFGIACEKAPGAGTRVLVAVDGSFAGELIIDDILKENSVDAIKWLKSKNIHTVMLTGDAEAAAKAVADEAGIDQLYAGLLPDQKLSLLQKIRSERGAVMYVGDGINDAPVLAGADVGAAMGSGADAAIEAADVVFMTSDPEAIPQSLTIAKKTGKIAWLNVYFALGVKLLVMLLGLFGHASMWLAVFADTGVAIICILNSIRLLYQRK